MLMPQTRPCLFACVPSATTFRAAGEPVHRLDAVAGRPHAVDLGAHPLVDRDAAAGAERDARRPWRGRRSGRTPRPRTTRSAGRVRPLCGVHRAGPAVAVGLDAGGAVAEDEVDAEPADRIGEEVADVRVEGADRGLRQVDDA